MQETPNADYAQVVVMLRQQGRDVCPACGERGEARLFRVSPLAESADDYAVRYVCPCGRKWIVEVARECVDEGGAYA